MTDREKNHIKSSNRSAEKASQKNARASQVAMADLLAEQLMDDGADPSTLPANEALADLTPAQRATEAARVGMVDHSVDIGATDSAIDIQAEANGLVTGGDPDANPDQAEVVGEEAIGGTTPTPDQSDVDDIAAAVGIALQPEHPIKVTEELQKRDEHRYELDPESKGPSASG